MTKDRSESARYGEGDVLSFAVRQHMLLLAYPPFGGFDATTAASTRLTALIEIFGVGTAGVFALIEACPHTRGATSHHSGDVIDNDIPDFRNVLTEINGPGAISREKLSEKPQVHYQ